MTSPWDAPAREVTVSRTEEHSIIAVNVAPPVGDDDRFAIEFRTDGGRTLRVMLPLDQLQALADVLHDLAAERERSFHETQTSEDAQAPPQDWQAVFSQG
jgi:hypothetical protein